MAENRAQSLVGRQVGPYKIHSLLGVGGMGEVYLAQDPRLDRTIALKILPTELASDPERIQRFIREARAASGLKHPNVATIYEIGKSGEIHFIAMEYVEGQTLADKISGRPLPIAEIVDIGLQVADGLDEAHRKGITHRDIKPANLMLTSREQVKILDFGLAKVTRPEGQPIGSDISTVVKTETGVVMGTVQYMSPEQVLGKEVDRRTDIFSLGVVLYEMTTGRLPFTGTSSSETMDRVLHGQPEAIARFNYDVPAELERIIRKCLEKVRERRYQSAADLVIDLKNLKRESGSEQVLQKSEHRNKSWIGLGVVGVGLLALVAVSATWYLSRPHPTSTKSPSQPIPLTSYPGIELSPTFSPDGSQVAFSWDGESQDNFDIYVKLIDRSDAFRLTFDPAADRSPTWSPDGRHIAFVRNGAVFLIPPLGGAESKVADVEANDIAWTRDGKSLVVSVGKSVKRRLVRLSVETGQKEQLILPPSQEDLDPSIGDLLPAVSPDGLRLAFVRQTATVSADIYVVPLANGEPRRLTQGADAALGVTWTADGREVAYASGGTKGAGVGMGLWRRSVEAPASSPSTQIESVGLDAFQPVISNSARLAYARFILDANIWVSKTTASSPPARKLVPSTRLDTNPQFSPDGRRLAFRSERSGSSQIWVANSDGSNPLQLTSLAEGNINAPRWSPDGKAIVFTAAQNNNQDIYSVSVDGGSVHRLTSAPSREGRPSWSRDGRWIYFYSTRSKSEEVWKMPAKEGEAEAVQLTTGGGHESFESPDGKLLYYEDFGVKGLRSMPIETYSGPTEGQVVLASVRPGFWAVTQMGIYFVEFDPRDAGSQDIYSALLGSRVATFPKQIKLYDFQTRQVTQIGTIEKDVRRGDPGFCATWDGRTIAWSQIDQRESDLMMIENFR
jgi:serine/threonine protein kinase